MRARGKPGLCVCAHNPPPLYLQYGQTAVHCAAGNGFIETVQLLLVSGAVVDAEDYVRTERWLAA